MTPPALDTIRPTDHLVVYSKRVKRNVPVRFASVNSTTGRHFCAHARYAHDYDASNEWYSADQIVEYKRVPLYGER